MLASSVSLHDVRDVEGLCRNVLDRYLRTSGGHLRPDHYEEALSNLFEVIVRLASRYDRSRSLTQLSFSTYASRLLEKRITDWYRKKFGDDRYLKCRHCTTAKVKWKSVDCSNVDGHQAPPPREVSLDALAAAADRDVDDFVPSSSKHEEEEVLVRVVLGL